MAKKTTAKTKATTDNIIFQDFDGKQREVLVIKNDKDFTVTKLELNAPISETIKKESDAITRANELVADTSN